MYNLLLFQRQCGFKPSKTKREVNNRTEENSFFVILSPLLLPHILSGTKFLNRKLRKSYLVKVKEIYAKST